MSSLVNIQSLITFLKKQIKVDMNIEINKIKNEYQTKINQLNSQISTLNSTVSSLNNQIQQLSKSNGALHMLQTYTINASNTAKSYKTWTIDTSTLDKSYKNYYLIVSIAACNNVTYGAIKDDGYINVVMSDEKAFASKSGGCASTTKILQILDINQNVEIKVLGVCSAMLIGI